MKDILRKILYFSFAYILIFPGCRQSTMDVSDAGIISADYYYEKNISVSQPEGNEYFSPGETIIIKWNFFTPVAQTDIYLYRKNQSQFAITLFNNNVGSYSWYIPNNIRPSLHYSIKVVNSTDSREFDYSESFSILRN